ncbi:MAG TPA: molybdenum cofactor biosynthesis protein B [Candidatus Rifleibacterium sp.]|jgi:molybdenum cofactor biosynthesis protein B|nr:molybdenum cofactor biosynthesis protein B [Candidatus Rifleibacterium sp.]HOI92418.1 molybdenum cofactor biosynthesis protein B [Candidatus Rifleibacterium sp.]HQB83775.1 molybdenum cofactor biosynthesis protein B [Candidatus Rifleibacterium sp.]
MGHREHEKMAAASLKVGVMTFSDTRLAADDKSGAILQEILKAGGHTISAYEVVKEDPELMLASLQAWLSRSDLDAIVTTGGTGLTARDGTVEVARRLFSKELDGFGELFRLISYQQIGTAAMLSRATAGLASGKMLICLPGSSKAVRLAATRLILPQLPHMLWEIKRQGA